MRASIAIAVLVTVAMALAFVVAAMAGGWHPSNIQYASQGIDVSHHQGTIQWSRLPAQGVDFAYIKATEGGDHRDTAFAWNWSQAGVARIHRGAYHFFTLCRPGEDQAVNFIAAVPNDPAALPPAVDLEFLGNCSARPAKAKLARELRTFIGLVERHYRKPVVLYLTEEFDRTYAVSATINRPLWLRNLIFEPDIGARPWTVWQVSNFRTLDGIDGRVDWNVMRR